MKKEVIIVGSMIYFSCIVHAMDEPEKKILSRKNTSNEGRTALTRRPSTDNETDRAEQIDGATVIQILPKDDKKEKRKSVVPHLNMHSVEQPSVGSLAQQMTGSRSQSSHNKSINNKAELLQKTASLKVVDQKIRKRAVSMSSMTHRVDTRRKDTDDEEEPRKRRSFLPKAMAQQIAGIDLSEDDEKVYTEEQVWALVGSFNPALFDFAVRHGIDDLQELAEYAAVMEQHDIKPKALIDHVYQNHQQQNKASLIGQGLQYIFGDPHEQHLEFLDKKFEKIKKEDPNRYRVLMFDLIKTAADEAAGQQNRSTIADAYATLANEQSTDQVTQIRQQWIGLALTGMGLVAGWVTSGIQYFSPAASTCNTTSA